MLALSSEQKISGNSRPSPTLLSRPAKINARISNHRELCAASDNVGANCIPTAGLLPLRKISEPMAGDQFADASKAFSHSRSAFARLAVRPFRLPTGARNDML